MSEAQKYSKLAAIEMLPAKYIWQSCYLVLDNAALAICEEKNMIKFLWNDLTLFLGCYMYFVIAFNFLVYVTSFDINGFLTILKAIK